MADFDLQNTLGFIIYRTAIKLKNELNKNFKNNGLDVTSDQWQVLVTLWNNEGLTQTEISDKLVKDKTSLTVILDRMEKKNLIIRSAHEHDRRSYKIFLTDKSRALVPKLIQVVDTLTQQIINGMNHQETKTVKEGLIQIYQNLE
jgi:DNA-binding MarR family transcriptional regulator